jgi:hypothetical protein
MYYRRIYFEGRGKALKAKIGIACASAEIKTEHLPNKILERYRRFNLLGALTLKFQQGTILIIYKNKQIYDLI